MTKKSKRKRPPPPGIVYTLDPSDPRSLDHPSHREAWLKLAEELGREAARRDFKKHIEGLRKALRNTDAGIDELPRATKSLRSATGR